MHCPPDPSVVNCSPCDDLEGVGLQVTWKRDNTREELGMVNLAPSNLKNEAENWKKLAEEA